MERKGSVAHAEDAKLHHSHAGRYLVVWIALMILTLVTWLVAQVHIPGGWGITVALAIASVKGALVALFFMHLYDQEGANRLVFVTSIIFVALLIGLTISDNATRFQWTNPPGSPGALPVEGAWRDPPEAERRP